ncbi:MAG: hypothetical protein ACFFD1_12785, partial [Candidatus Thorarchaeota archaeon]
YLLSFFTYLYSFYIKKKFIYQLNYNLNKVIFLFSFNGFICLSAIAFYGSIVVYGQQNSFFQPLLILFNPSNEINLFFVVILIYIFSLLLIVKYRRTNT